MSSLTHPSFRKCTYNRARLHRHSRNVSRAINYILQCVPTLSIVCTHLWSSYLFLFVIKDRWQRSWALSAFTFGVLDLHRHIDGDPMQLIFDLFLQKHDGTLHPAHNALRSREMSLQREWLPVSGADVEHTFALLCCLDWWSLWIRSHRRPWRSLWG